MILSTEILLNLLHSEGHDEIQDICLPSKDLVLDEALSESWKQLLSEQVSIKEFIDDSWGQKDLLPLTTNIIKDKLISLALLVEADGVTKRLLYVFKCDEDFVFYSGALPKEDIAESITALDAGIEMLLSIHDGFFQLTGGILELTNAADLELMIQDYQKGESAGFLRLLTVNTDWLGFDLEANPLAAYVIWGSDGEVKKVTNFFTELDDFLHCQLEDFEDAE